MSNKIQKNKWKVQDIPPRFNQLNNTGAHDKIPGDSILGIYSTQYLNFKTPQGKKKCKPCSSCEKNKLSHLLLGKSTTQCGDKLLLDKVQCIPQITNPTYGTVYSGNEQVFRNHPYENIYHIPCTNYKK